MAAPCSYLNSHWGAYSSSQDTPQSRFLYENSSSLSCLPLRLCQAWMMVTYEKPLLSSCAWFLFPCILLDSCGMYNLKQPMVLPTVLVQSLATPVGEWETVAGSFLWHMPGCFHWSGEQAGQAASSVLLAALRWLVPILIAPCLCLPGTNADWLLSILRILMDKPDSVERWGPFCYKFRTSSFLFDAKLKLTMF